MLLVPLVGGIKPAAEEEKDDYERNATQAATKATTEKATPKSVKNAAMQATKPDPEVDFVRLGAVAGVDAVKAADVAKSLIISRSRKKKMSQRKVRKQLFVS